MQYVNQRCSRDCFLRYRRDSTGWAPRPFFFYVDEFQNYAVDSFGSIVSEARKYHLYLTVANQTLKQIPGALLSEIFGNVATVVALAISAEDAATMRREMSSKCYLVGETEQRKYDRMEGVAYTAGLWRELLVWVIGSDQLPKRQLTAYDSLNLLLEKNVKETIAKLEAEKLLQYPTSTGITAVLPIGALLGGVFEFLKDPQRNSFQPRSLTSGEWPTATDFLNAKPLSGFVKVERPENVRALTVSHPAAKPDAGRLQAVLAAQRARQAENGGRTAAQEPRSPADPTPGTPLNDSQEGESADDVWS